MGITDSIWEDIERSESYLVSCMYEEAASSSSSILKRLCENNKCIGAGKDVELFDMLESAGMVLVQSLKELGRTSEILNELKVLCTPVTAIPVQVLLTGACMQISEGSSSGVQEFIEEFLSYWTCVDQEYYVLVGAEANVDFKDGWNGRLVLGIDKYLEVVEFYVVTLLATVLNDMDLAVSWVEKAALPEEQRQGILRRLHSLHSIKATTLSRSSFSPSLADDHEICSSLKEQNLSEGSPKSLKEKYTVDGEYDTKQAILKLSGRPCFWWFRSITLKFGKARLVVSNGKIVMGCLVLLVYYILRRKRTTLQRLARRQALSVKKALVDLWQLAFSYQVNPLAAVQPLPASTRGGR